MYLLCHGTSKHLCFSRTCLLCLKIMDDVCAAGMLCVHHWLSSRVVHTDLFVVWMMFWIPFVLPLAQSIKDSFPGTCWLRYTICHEMSKLFRSLTQKHQKKKGVLSYVDDVTEKEQSWISKNRSVSPMYSAPIKNGSFSYQEFLGVKSI
jgi:hypothetical protein